MTIQEASGPPLPCLPMQSERAHHPATDWSRIPGSAPAFGTEDIGQERRKQVLDRGVPAGCHHGRSDAPLDQRPRRKHADIGQAGETGAEGGEHAAVGIALAGQAEDAIGIQVAGVVPPGAWLGGGCAHVQISYVRDGPGPVGNGQ
ncbi:MAG: hypothetical protein EBU21_16510 [Proteobacteria bacterium]|nr:hypothetical protein [Pseudomonadota bacterium]